jgi:tungstate transport system ATP-binding protein
MMDGRIRQIGTPEGLWHAADEDVAQSSGVETITHGRVQSVDDGVALVEVGGHTIEGGSGVDAGDDVLVCLRPEDVSISPAREDSLRTSVRNHLSARVTSIMPWGAFQRLNWTLVSSLR